MNSIEAIDIPVIEGTEITAGDVLSLARSVTLSIPEYPYEELQRGFDGIDGASIESVSALLNEKGVRDDVKTRALSLLKSMAELARTSAERHGLEANLNAASDLTLF